MRLRRSKGAPASADPEPVGPARPGPRNQPAAGDISSVGVAIMPGMPLPDWVTGGSFPQPTSPAWPDSAEGPPDAFAAGQFAAAPVSSFPQIDPAYEAAFAPPAPQDFTVAAPVPEYPQPAPTNDAAFAAAPVPVTAFPQVDPAYEAALTAAVAPTAPAVPAPAAELPPPDPAQWSEQPNGTVVWGPVPVSAGPAPEVDLPAQAPAVEALPAAVPLAAGSLAFAPPPTGPAFFVDPPDDAADLEAPDLQPPAALVPVDEPTPEPEAGPSAFVVTPEDDGPVPPVFDVVAPESAAAFDWSGFQASVVPESAGAAEGGAAALSPRTAPEPSAQPEPAQPWFVTDQPDDAPPPPTSGAGQYGWLFEPDAPAQAEPEARLAASATAWFDPRGSADSTDGPGDDDLAGGMRSATVATVPGQWAGQSLAEPVAAEDDWMTAHAPVAAVAAGSAAGETVVAAAPPMAPVAPLPPPPPPASPMTPTLTDRPIGLPATRQAPAASVSAAAAPVAPQVSAPPVSTTAPPQRLAAPVQPPAVAALVPPPVPAATRTEASVPPPTTTDATPESEPGRSNRWLLIAGIGLVVAALAVVALYVYPGLLKTEASVSSPPVIATPATAGGLTRTARVAAPVAAAFRRTAAAVGATASSKYATYASDQGITATVWDSNGTAASPATTMRAYENSGGVELGAAADVPAGIRGGSMACAAASATRTVCVWNAGGVTGAADIRGLARSEAGALAAKIRPDLEQPTAPLS